MSCFSAIRLTTRKISCSWGGAAFDYYFPVIDRYIRKVTGDEEGDDCEVAILGSAVAAKFDSNGANPSDALVCEIEQLADYVSSNVAQYSPAARDQRRIKREWDRVHKKIAARKNKSEQDGAGQPPTRSEFE